MQESKEPKPRKITVRFTDPEFIALEDKRSKSGKKWQKIGEALWLGWLNNGSAAGVSTSGSGAAGAGGARYHPAHRKQHETLERILLAEAPAMHHGVTVFLDWMNSLIRDDVTLNEIGYLLSGPDAEATRRAIKLWGEERRSGDQVDQLIAKAE